ncbi:MAG: hypothetical protein L0G99_14050, partial [Propionibacteriales bacterium]|nr:hypothetical protein [Propionibacteriales bacterium]
PFDLILCLYDSVNHLDGIESVAVMARAAAEAARPGALLVVDLNTALAFVGWAGTDEVIDDEFGRLAGRGSYDAETGEASLHLEGYLLDETGEKRWFAETETERLLDPAALLAALTRAGWGSHRLTTYADLTAEVTAPDEAQRLVVVSLRASEHDP